MEQTVTDGRTVTDGANVAIANTERYHVSFQLAYLHLIFAHSKDQGQGHAYFACKYLANGDR